MEYPMQNWNKFPRFILALTLLSACRVVIPGVGVWECQYQNVNGWLTPVCDLVG